MAIELQIIAALLLDLAVGDPRSLPHPVQLIGRFAAACETFFRKALPSKRLAGALTVTSVLLATAMTVAILLNTVSLLFPWAYEIVSVLLLYTCFATHDLEKHSREVSQALAEKNLPEARRRVAMIVGRDTEDLNEEDVARACVESVAENIVDGVTGPLFFAFLGGPIGALLYKAINTMDSTFGYKNEKYKKFGMAAARLDDIANFLPARISGLLVVCASFFLRMDPKASWRIFVRDRNQHASPNAGQTEAAVAGALGLQFGGTNIYFGHPVTKPTIGDPTTSATEKHILKANRILYATTGLAAACFTIFSLAIRL